MVSKENAFNKIIRYERFKKFLADNAEFVASEKADNKNGIKPILEAMEEYVNILSSKIVISEGADSFTLDEYIQKHIDALESDPSKAAMFNEANRDPNNEADYRLYLSEVMSTDFDNIVAAVNADNDDAKEVRKAISKANLNIGSRFGAGLTENQLLEKISAIANKDKELENARDKVTDAETERDEAIAARLAAEKRVKKVGVFSGAIVAVAIAAAATFGTLNACNGNAKDLGEAANSYQTYISYILKEDAQKDAVEGIIVNLIEDDEKNQAVTYEDMSEYINNYFANAIPAGYEYNSEQGLVVSADAASPAAYNLTSDGVTTVSETGYTLDGVTYYQSEVDALQQIGEVFASDDKESYSVVTINGVTYNYSNSSDEIQTQIENVQLKHDYAKSQSELETLQNSIATLLDTNLDDNTAKTLENLQSYINGLKNSIEQGGLVDLTKICSILGIDSDSDYDAVLAAAQKYVDDLATALEENASINSELSALQNKISTICDTCGITAAEGQDKLDALSAYISNLSSNSDLSGLASILGLAEDASLKEIIEKVEDLINTISNLQEQVAEKNDEITTLKADLLAAQASVADLTQQINDLRAQYNDLVNSGDDATAKIAELLSQVDSLSDQLTTAQNNVASLKVEIQAKEDALASANTTISELQTTNATLQVSYNNLYDLYEALQLELKAALEGNNYEESFVALQEIYYQLTGERITDESTLISEAYAIMGIVHESGSGDKSDYDDYTVTEQTESNFPELSN